MRKTTWLRGAMALAAMLTASAAMAADHLDGPAARADPTEDITDLFTWMDGTDVVLVLDVNPGATAATKFSNAVQYVFHTASAAGYPQASPVEVPIICTFDTGQHISCWVGATDYVTGDASVAGGITSASGNVKVYAGLRDDPFFFNLKGLVDAEADVESAQGLVLDLAGCPALPATILADLGHTTHGTTPAVDFFSPSASYSGNVLSIVLSIKSSLLTTGGPMMSVWASTNKAM